MANSISESLITAQFFTSMYTCGITPRENFNPDMDGKTHRFAVERDKGNAKSGAYFIHNDDDDAITWGVMDHHIHSEMQTFTFDYSTLDADTRREFLKQQNISNANGFSGIPAISQKKEDRANANKENQQQALRIALAEYQYAEPFAHETYIFTHPYFKKKFFDTGLYSDILRCSIVRDYRIAKVLDPYEGGICRKGELIVPLRNILTGDFQSIIHIPATPDSEGRFIKYNYRNTSLKGAAHWLITEKSRNADTLFCCEGITTALALLVDLQGRYPVFSCGSCGNLHSVCEGLRERYADKAIIVIADNDANHAGENAAKKCIETGLADSYEMPSVTGWDWYDDYLSRKKKGA